MPTEPSNKSGGYPTQGRITANMSNNPKGTAFKADFYSGKKGMAPVKVKKAP